ncbi:hypothetical protein EVAR_15887_1 [Eumeta japonica]|uniref:Uncharacterized protein n=1 Tax=Eumeta variegata TaxID=151549 RepID=A0A4C1UE02_EUMVA|nr:hypothetical protein EVAR_15887_1 [Eumeta japonica]
MKPAKEATREPSKPATAKQTAASASPLAEEILTIMSMLRLVKSPEFVHLVPDFRKARGGEDHLMETFLKTNRPKACKLADYIQVVQVVGNNRLVSPRSGIAVYYKNKLYCCPLDIPPLLKFEASTCKLTMTGHGTLIIVSVNLPLKKRLLRSDIKILLALGDAVILFDDLNTSTGQSRADGILCQSDAIDEVLKAPIYWGYGRPTNMLIGGCSIRESRTRPTHGGQLISNITLRLLLLKKKMSHKRLVKSSDTLTLYFRAVTGADTTSRRSAGVVENKSVECEIAQAWKAPSLLCASIVIWGEGDARAPPVARPGPRRTHYL